MVRTAFIRVDKNQLKFPLAIVQYSADQGCPFETSGNGVQNVSEANKVRCHDAHIEPPETSCCTKIHLIIPVCISSVRIRYTSSGMENNSC